MTYKDRSAPQEALAGGRQSKAARLGKRRERIRSFAYSSTGRLLLGTLAIHACLIPILVVGILHIAAKGDRDRFVHSVQAQSHLLARLLNQTPDPARIAQLSQELVANGYLAHAEYAPTAAPSIAAPDNAAPHGIAQNSRVDATDGHIYYTAVPLRAHDGGVLRVGFDETAVNEHIRQFYQTNLALGAGYLLLSVAIIAFFGRRLMRSVHCLRGASRRIAGGHLDERLVVETGISEIADLAHDLEHMRKTLVQEISQRIAYESRLTHLATHDSLTGLPNRALYQDRLSHILALAERSGDTVALLFVDLDRFKRINDTLGHHVGDALLLGAAARLKQCLRDEDTVARIGGDEFTVILPRLTDPSGAVVVAENIIHALEQPFAVAGQELRISCSIGIACYPCDGVQAGDLWCNADMAMYAAKNGGGMAYRFYSDQMNAKAATRLELEARLRRALEHGEFCLHYQPQADAITRRIVGVEALIRWQHPERGLVPPAEFIAVTEETGLIVPISEWVLRTACRQCKEWGDQGIAVRVSVNLSARHFAERELLATVREVLRETGLAPHLLELELTESMVMQDGEDTIAVLQKLKQLGVTLTLDDFGTGYSSLAYLQRFPIDTLKIDRAFIQDIGGHTDEGTLASTIIAMAEHLRMNVVAEGVESSEQWDYLRAHGCHTIQGYYLSKPLPAEAATRFLKTSAQAHAVEAPALNLKSPAAEPLNTA